MVATGQWKSTYITSLKAGISEPSARTLVFQQALLSLLSTRRSPGRPCADVALPHALRGFEPCELVKGRWMSGTQEQGELWSCLVLLLSLPLLKCLTSAAATGNVPLLPKCQETQRCC